MIVQSHAKPLSVMIITAAMALVSAAASATSYTWNNNGSGPWTTSTNWTPTRSATASSDVLIIDGSVTTGPVILTSIPNQTIAQLQIINGVTASLEAGGTPRTITLSAISDTLKVDATSTLKIIGTGVEDIFISIPSGGTGTVDGVVDFQKDNDAIKGAGTFTLSSGATLKTINTQGVSNGAGGSIQTTTQNLDSGANYYLQATAPQGTGSGFPSLVTGSLVVNCPGITISQSADITINGTLTLSAGNFQVQNGKTLTIGGNCSIGSGTTLAIANGGTLNYTTAIATSGSGNFNCNNGATLSIYSTGGVNAQVSGPTLSLSTGAKYTFSGIAAQVTGASFPSTVNTLKIDNPTTVSLSNSVTVSSLLNLNNGALVPGGNTLLAPDGPTAVTRTAGFVSGSLSRSISAATNGTRIFPVGTSAYSGVDVTLDGTGSGSGTLAVTSPDGHAPNVPNTNTSINRYWSLTLSGGSITGGSTDLTFHYLDSDVTGVVVESTMAIGRNYSGSLWQEFSASSRDTVNNSISVTNIPGFSNWTLGNPGTLPVTISALQVD